jgi:sensor histidine kinase regulating citrate/malate metabolism
MHEMEIKLNEVEKAWEIEQNHYSDIEARRDELAKIRHDISEQFLVMQELLHQQKYEKVIEMVDTLREYVASTKEYVYCADPVVNAIMAENERECKKKGIRFDYNLEIMQPLKINPVVICSIFSNLLRNALAATTEVEDKTKAAIEIKATIKGDYLVVKVNNTFSALKKKNQRKGYGLDILRNLVEKYNGQMDVVVKDGNYSTSISVENIELNEKNASL